MSSYVRDLKVGSMYHMTATFMVLVKEISAKDVTFESYEMDENSDKFKVRKNNRLSVEDWNGVMNKGIETSKFMGHMIPPAREWIRNLFRMELST